MEYLQQKSYVCAYGTLMSYNTNSLLNKTDSKLVKETTINGFQIYANLANFIYPTLKEETTATPVYVEIWEVDNTTLKLLDRYEGVDQELYKRSLITVDELDCYIYEYNGRITSNMIKLKNNNWLQFINDNEDDIRAFNFYSSEWYEMQEKEITETFCYNVNTGNIEQMHISEIEDLIDNFSDKIKKY